jgi:hypothetical protein
MGARWKSRALLTILLIAPLALAAASGANAQAIQLAPGQTLNVSTGFTNPNPTGDVFRAPTNTTKGPR